MLLLRPLHHGGHFGVVLPSKSLLVPRRVARIWKREGFFERVRKVQTALTWIFIVLESVSHSLSENWDEISRKARNFKRFFSPKPGGLQKKRSSPKLSLIFRPKTEIQTFFQPKNRWSSKKKVFTEIGSDFSAKIQNSNAFSHRITTSTSRLRHPFSFVGGCFQFLTKNRPQKHQKRAILHTSQTNGGGGARAPPGYATACASPSESKPLY